MTDLAISVFRLSNRRGYSVPTMNIDYTELETGLEWRLTCGGSRAYVVRIGATLDRDFDVQAADSHFMIHRITSSLLLGGVGLFQAEATGRLILKDIEGRITWTSQLDALDPLECAPVERQIEPVFDWCRALCKHNLLRRAADDAHLALTHPHEALVFVYRGLEWLKLGLGVDWKQLAQEMKVPLEELRELRKTANYETGVRHATRTGAKMRARGENYSSWVCVLLEAINVARVRLEPDFSPMSSNAVAEAIKTAVPTVPYE